MDISIIIVSYNVKYLLAGLLHSLQQALQQKISYEIIVVDNNSTDNTPEYISGKALNLTIIKNKENLGFAAANNQGIAVAKGKYILLINPDTLVEEDIFEKLIAFLEKHPQYGGVTAKMLNPDGSFAIDCRHGIPSPRDAFYKAMGMTKIFPNSKHFSYYHQTFLEENDENDIPAFSGAFMLLREKTVNEVGLLDDSFFMYCEDIDYCYRLNKNGWKIRYLPVTRLLHFKGESTKEKSYEYVKNFNLSMLRFFKKYYAFKYSGLFYIFIKTGVFLRGILLVIKNFLFFLFSNTINQLFKNEQNYLFIEGNSEFSIPNSYKRRNIKLHTSNLEFSKVLNNKWLNEIQFDIRKKTINKVIFDISIGYKVIFNIMEKLSALKIDFAFYYPEWNILMEKGGGEFLNNNVFYKDV